MFELQNYSEKKSKTMSKEIVIDEEVKWEKKKTIVSKTDVFGVISYVNSVFSNTSEYDKLELIGEPHSIIRHPDMPKVIFKVLWDALKKDENIHAIVKNRTKTGKYYWVITDFTIDKDKNNKTVGYIARRRAVPDGVVEKIKPLYKLLLDIEQTKGEKASELYLKAFLDEEIKKSYNEFVVDLFEEEKIKEKRVQKENILKKTLKWFFITDYE